MTLINAYRFYSDQVVGLAIDFPAIEIALFYPLVSSLVCAIRHSPFSIVKQESFRAKGERRTFQPMRERELNRLEIVQRVKRKRLKQQAAAERLGLTERRLTVM